MNPLPQTNGDGAQQIVIVLAMDGSLTVNAPVNKIIALGMLSAAKAVIVSQPMQQTILPVKRILPS